MRKLLCVAIIASSIVSCDPARHVAGTTDPDKYFDIAEVERIEKILSSDDMAGREPGTPGIDKAATFIEKEFKAAGLETFNGLSTYRQEFNMIEPVHIATSGSVGDKPANAGNVLVITQKEEVTVTDRSGYEKVNLKAGQSISRELRKYTGKNIVVMLDTSFTKIFPRLAGFLRAPSFATDATQVLILSESEPTSYSITAKHKINQVKYANVVGVLPGKSRKDEYVVFSSHYDHLGIGKPTAEGDSIYNGANDDAAGTTAVLMLAKYFKAKNDNERTLVFVTFTAEESGGFGSQYFSKQLNPDKTMAMFNIEMIGTESKWGTNSAYITGFEKTDMGTILQKNLEGTGFTFHPDPYPQQQLFLRSDNATLARLGVPAHTISTSKMDVEKYYHTADDEITTLDMKNMAAIIKAIALSSKGIVAATETPTRVKN